jgi:hypothetical protein
MAHGPLVTCGLLPSARGNAGRPINRTVARARCRVLKRPITAETLTLGHPPRAPLCSLSSGRAAQLLLAWPRTLSTSGEQSASTPCPSTYLLQYLDRQRKETCREDPAPLWPRGRRMRAPRRIKRRCQLAQRWCSLPVTSSSIRSSW